MMTISLALFRRKISLSGGALTILLSQLERGP